MNEGYFKEINLFCHLIEVFSIIMSSLSNILFK